MFRSGSDNPCKPECQNRTATCKFDGTCDKYKEWRKAFDEHAEKCSRIKEMDKTVDDYRLIVNRRLNAGKLKTRRRNDDR